jgi:hypothetical protein
VLGNLTIKDAGLQKYFILTGKGKEELTTDLSWHWLDNFQSLTLFSALRERIKDPALCGSMATTLAVNKYIVSHNSSKKEIKELFAGSKWRWSKSACGDYIQTTLYADYSMSCIYFRAEQNDTGFSGLPLSTIRNIIPYITRQAHMYHTQVVSAREDQETTLQWHATRATDTFCFKKGKTGLYNTFLGVELEFENHTREAFKTLNLLKEHAIFKRDGSLKNGVEICTAPATLDVHKEEFKSFFDGFVYNNCKLAALSSCGMHVHIDKSKLSGLHVANLCLLLNHVDNNLYITAIAGREQNSYCKVKQHTYLDFTSFYRGDRYNRVNLTQEKTVELRLFASTTNYIDFCKRLEFTQAVVDYTRPGETNITCKNIPVWSNFKEYVLKHTKFYPTLAKTM